MPRKHHIGAVKGRQIRAARGLLGWQSTYLAEKVGLARETISKIEDESVQPRAKNLADIIRIFDENDIEFIDRGVQWVSDVVKTLNGDNAYLRMLDDVYYSTSQKGGEVLFFCSSDRWTFPGERESEIRIRKAGVRFRSLIEEGNNETAWPRNEYRQIPKKYFNHNLQVIYVDKVAQILDDGRQVLIIHNKAFATSARNNFDLIWSLMKPIPKLGKKNER